MMDGTPFVRQNGESSMARFRESWSKAVGQLWGGKFGACWLVLRVDVLIAEILTSPYIPKTNGRSFGMAQVARSSREFFVWPWFLIHS